MLSESARIARGAVSDISNLKTNNYAALFVPGGFGVAKNLSNFAFEGHRCTVNRQVEEVIRSFHVVNV